MLLLLVFNVIIGSISVFICCNHVLIGFVAICRVLQIEFDYTCMCSGGVEKGIISTVKSERKGIEWM